MNLTRTGWLQMFTQLATPNMFLSRMFTVKPGGQYNGGKVAIDIERSGEDVAITVKKSTGPNINDVSIFTTKEFEPPAYGEAVPFDVNTLVNRMAGTDPFTAAYQEYAVSLNSYMLKAWMKIYNKIVRAIELQASQILQTGKLSLVDTTGAVSYELDFSPKATHFPTAGTAWASVGATPLADLEALAKIIRADGQINPDRLIFGDAALNAFLDDDAVQKKLDVKNYDLGMIAPGLMDSGATFYGFVWIGAYRFEMWTYPETFKHPQTGASTQFINSGNVVMMSSRTRLDKASASVPLPFAPDPRVADLIPGRMQSADFDVTPNVYLTPNGKQLTGELESCTLLIPVQIDGFGCLDTGL